MNDSVRKSIRERHLELADKLSSCFSEKDCEVISQFDEVTLIVPSEHLIEVAETLRDGEEFEFRELIDLCGVDYSDYGLSEWETTTASGTGFGRGVDPEKTSGNSQPSRFASVYHLLSMEKNIRMRVRVYLDDEQPMVESVTGIWSGADWFERESFDLYGILYNGHSDLRRILTDYGFMGHPFRKDFPLEGHVELRYDPEQKRVIYEPVTIEPRTLVPRVIREDNRYLEPDSEQQDTPDA
ncbi:MAG: NADH-quinone oxidoreductase subunit C [Gammaproteobacteria bacterium]|nr:NADH-quinone oxidoreductase subunit C [Gammaproteobacteria bacterium]